MNLKIVTIAVAIVVLGLQWPYLNAWRADATLSDFYREMATARFGDARNSIDEAIRLAPSNARYYTWRAYCKSQSFPSQCPRTARSSPAGFDRASVQDAIRDYRRALELNSRDAVAHHNLAWLEHLLGDDAAAENDWHESIELDPATAVFHVSYGMFLDESGKADAARAQYETAVELTPSIVDSPFFTRYSARNAQLADSIVAESIAKLETRLQGGNDPILEARLGKLYLYDGKRDRAGVLLNSAVKQLPNLPLVWFNLGELHALQGELEQAMDCYKKANVVSASLAGPYLKMGEISFQNGDKRSAGEDFRLAAQRWQRMNPITAAHNNRLYNGPSQLIDDLLPTTLVWYTTPCEASRAWRGLSQLFPEQKEYARRSRTCEQLPSPHGFLDLD